MDWQDSDLLHGSPPLFLNHHRPTDYRVSSGLAQLRHLQWTFTFSNFWNQDQEYRREPTLANFSIASYTRTR